MYRGAACSNCNLKFLVDDNFIGIYFHNLNYDKNFFLKELSKYKNDRLTVLPYNKEKFVSFSQYMKVKCGDKYFTAEMRYLDSFRFLSSSLDVLVKTLSNDELRHLKSHFPNPTDHSLLSNKGFFPYSWLDSEEKFQDVFPAKEAFFNDLTEENISQENYDHALNVYNHFNCQNMGDYAELYLSTDVLLLADVFESFRLLAMKNYGLEVCHYYSIASFSWDAMLYKTGVKLELMTCPEEIEFIQKGIRGGITVCNQTYSRANNKDMKCFDKTLPQSHLKLYDANNLYPHCMAMNLPYKDFKFVDRQNMQSEFNAMLNSPEDSETGWILEVTLSVPHDKHDFFNDYPLCPENKIPPGGKFKKLILDLEKKVKYVIHYKNLQLALELGMELECVHRIMKFSQSPWMKTYIDLNTKLRIEATTSFAKDFFKLLSNSVYGKSFENVLKHREVKLVTRWKPQGKKLCAQTLIAKPNFHSIIKFTETFCSIEMTPVTVKMNKPLYIGLVVLEYSRHVMANFFYNYLLKKFADCDIRLLYTDTDNFLIKVNCESWFDKIRDDIAKYFDTSEMDISVLKKYNLPIANHKVLGMFKCETAGLPIIQFVGLKAKCYALEVEGRYESYIKARCKGIAKAKVRKFDINSYLDVLKHKTTFTSTMKRITSKLLTVKTICEKKKALSSGDDKRFQIPDSYETLAWGHRDIIWYQLETYD